MGAIVLAVVMDLVIINEPVRAGGWLVAIDWDADMAADMSRGKKGAWMNFFRFGCN